MMSRHFALSSELTGAIAKRLPHAKIQLSVTGSFFNQFVTDIYIYTVYILLYGEFHVKKPIISPPSTDWSEICCDRALICLYLCENFRSIGCVVFEL